MFSARTSPRGESTVPHTSRVRVDRRKFPRFRSICFRAATRSSVIQGSSRLTVPASFTRSTSKYFPSVSPCLSTW